MTFDSISINDLKIPLYIGILPWEQEITQTIVLNVQFEININTAAASDAIEDTIDYSKIAIELEELLTNKKINLLESVAIRVSNHLLDNYSKINRVKIDLLKPHAIKNAASVGVSIVRTREKSA